MVTAKTSVYVSLLCLLFSSASLAATPIPEDASVTPEVFSKRVACEHVIGHFFVSEKPDQLPSVTGILVIKGNPSPVNIDTELRKALDDIKSEASLKFGCLANADGIGLSFKNKDNADTIIHLNNDGRVFSTLGETGLGLTFDDEN
jgi:hypothetical protein